MDTEEAQELLSDDSDIYFHKHNNDDFITMDGRFNVEQLKACIVLLEDQEFFNN